MKIECSIQTCAGQTDIIPNLNSEKSMNKKPRNNISFSWIKKKMFNSILS